ncbi:hypothetical protein POM88_044628 [Heracleum sosnowskyi]|uniref:HTH myb-type domain-containing protein n=1 Tax=Heracleum sosnowskyi TaxID=360622 RepID=A0AAD8M5E3_9APIA|nr:hypothetical protein POM88_044628 [Heracleum sosnowskyi]
MSSPMNSSVPSPNNSMNLSYSMQQLSMQQISEQQNYAVHQIQGSSAMTGQFPCYHQAPAVQHTQHLAEPIGPQQELQQTQEQPQQIVEEGQVQFQRPLLGMGKPRLYWSRGLHARFVRAVSELGGSSSATPKEILNKMNVPGLTREQVKSHLQKVRTSEARKTLQQGMQNSVNGSLQLSGQGPSAASWSSAPLQLSEDGWESFKADIQAYGQFLQSSETPPMYSQHFMFAPEGDYQENANGSKFGF